MLLLSYTICFCLCGERVLMLYRRKAPNANLWNGLGGKIEAGETPFANIYRETMEEAEIDLHQAEELRFAGLVSWTFLNDPARSNRGMYTFLARLAPGFPLFPDRPMAEGIISWKPLAWVCDLHNTAVVSNIPHFLPRMLTNREPQEYRCTYEGETLQAFEVRPLPHGITERVCRREQG